MNLAEHYPSINDTPDLPADGESRCADGSCIEGLAKFLLSVERAKGVATPLEPEETTLETFLEERERMKRVPVSAAEIFYQRNTHGR